jgi:hypothetical protein
MLLRLPNVPQTCPGLTESGLAIDATILTIY